MKKQQEFISIELIDPNPYQNANYRDQAKIEEIAGSLYDNLKAGIGTNGLLQVPTARRVDGRYQLAFGHHRMWAFQALCEQGKENFRMMPLIIEDLNDLQMFEAMAQENLQRRDISFMEEAEMYYRYISDFHKTSPETALRFGKTEEYIRGRIMFLQLPDEVKEAAKAGEINVSTARDLVSVRKLIGDEGVADAVDDIKQDIFDNPREAIEQAIRASDSAIEIPNGLKWLDVKKFPVKHLTPLNEKTLAELLDVEKGDKARKEMLQQVMQLLASGMEIVDGNFPSFDAGALQKVRILANPSACIGCDFHTAFDGDHWCGFKLCYERKYAAWQRHEVEELWKTIGIPLYVNEATDGKCVELSRWEEADRKLFDDKHEDLRLKPTTRSIYNNFGDLPSNVMLVAVGKTAEKRLEKKEKAESSRQKEQDARILEQAKRSTIIDAVRKFVWEVGAPAFEGLLDGINNLPFAMFLFDEGMFKIADFPEGVDEAEEQLEQISGMKRKVDAMKQLRLLMIHQMVWRATEWQDYGKPAKPVMDVAKRLQSRAGEWDHKLPRGFMNQAENAQAALDQALRDLQAEFKAQQKGESK